MKKSFVRIVLFLFSLVLFAQSADSEAAEDAKNIVYSESFSIKGISSLKMNLTFENLITEEFYGDEITVEIDCNNDKKTPVVKLNSNNLEIKSTKQKYSKGDVCTVYVYIPKKYTASSVEINTTSGNININNLITGNSIKLKTEKGGIFIKDIYTSYINLKSGSGKIKGENLAVDYFDIQSDSGEIDTAFDDAPFGKSRVESDSGKISLKLPYISDFNLEVSSESGTFWDFFKGDHENPKRVLKREYGLGGSVVVVKTNTSDIFLKKNN